MSSLINTLELILRSVNTNTGPVNKDALDKCKQDILVKIYKVDGELLGPKRDVEQCDGEGLDRMNFYREHMKLIAVCPNTDRDAILYETVGALTGPYHQELLEFACRYHVRSHSSANVGTINIDMTLTERTLIVKAVRGLFVDEDSVAPPLVNTPLLDEISDIDAKDTGSLDFLRWKRMIDFFGCKDASKFKKGMDYYNVIGMVDETPPLYTYEFRTPTSTFDVDDETDDETATDDSQNGDGVDGDGGGGGDISTDYETEQNEYLTFSAVPYLHNGFRAMSMDDKDGEEKAVEPPNNYPLTTSPGAINQSLLDSPPISPTRPLANTHFFSSPCGQGQLSRSPEYPLVLPTRSQSSGIDTGDSADFGDVSSDGGIKADDDDTGKSPSTKRIRLS